jgi:hypothetical protein
MTSNSGKCSIIPHPTCKLEGRENEPGQYPTYRPGRKSGRRNQSQNETGPKTKSQSPVPDSPPPTLQVPIEVEQRDNQSPEKYFAALSEIFNPRTKWAVATAPHEPRLIPNGVENGAEKSLAPEVDSANFTLRIERGLSSVGRAPQWH